MLQPNLALEILIYLVFLFIFCVPLDVCKKFKNKVKYPFKNLLVYLIIIHHFLGLSSGT